MPLPTAAQLHEAGRARSAIDRPGTIGSYYPFWDTQYRPFLLLALASLPAERLDYKPRPDMLTARQLVVHIAEGERGWTHTVVEGGTYEEWVVPHADPAQGWELAIEAPDHAALEALLAEWHKPTQRLFERSVSELARVFDAARPGGNPRPCTLHWILDHVQEHELHHRAQLNLYLRLLGIEPPSI